MYLHRIEVKDVRGFSKERNVVLTFARSDDPEVRNRYRGWTVVAGRNGSGKTTLLRSIALALAGPEVANMLTDVASDWISHDAASATVLAEIHRDGGEINLGPGEPAEVFSAALRWSTADGAHPRPQIERTMSKLGGTMAEASLWSAKPTGWFAAGYGPFRRLAGTTGEVAHLMAGDYPVSRFVTLFREAASLAETVQWLQQVNYRARSDRPGYSTLEAQVLALLNDGLFPDGHTVDHVDPDGVWIRRVGRSPILIEEMSDGYRTVTALVTDIVRQIHQCYGGNLQWEDGGPRLSTGGVVLIDEVDAHLHVSWQKRIGPWLVDHFPFVQFIVTTHSPYVCQTADPEGLIRLPGPDDNFASTLSTSQPNHRTRSSLPRPTTPEMITMSSNDVEKWLDELDPASVDWRAASHFRAIRAAHEVIECGQRDLVQAVIAARAAGDSWTIIGAALGVSKQAASERFDLAVRAAQS